MVKENARSGTCKSIGIPPQAIERVQQNCEYEQVRYNVTMVKVKYVGTFSQEIYI